MQVEMGDETNVFLVFVIPFILVVPKFVPKVSSWLSRRFFLANEKELSTVSAALQIKKEMNAISMVDEFAKYAKLQRRLNQLTLDLDSSAGARKSLQSKLIKIISTVLYVLISILYLAVVISYGTSTPVFIVPKNWFYPLNGLFSFPTGIAGAVSIPIWTVLTRNALSLVIK